MPADAARSGPSLGDRILDALFGLGALMLLLPLAPFLLLLWLWDQLQRDDELEAELER